MGCGQSESGSGPAQRPAPSAPALGTLPARAACPTLGHVPLPTPVWRFVCLTKETLNMFPVFFLIRRGLWQYLDFFINHGKIRSEH